MESRYKLKITPAAENDLDEIYNYISNSLLAPNSALSLMDKIEDSIKKLCDYPFKYELSRNELLRQKGYRKLVVDNYVILYLVEEQGNIVTIARVFYGAMEYEKYI